MKNNQNKKKREREQMTMIRDIEMHRLHSNMYLTLNRESREECKGRGTNEDNDDNDYTRKMNRKIETTWALFKYCAFISIDFRVERSQDSFSPFPA